MARNIRFASLRKHHRLWAVMFFAATLWQTSLAVILADEPEPKVVDKQIPDDWLIWALVPKLSNIEQHADKILEPFGIRLVGARQILQTYCGNALADDRPILFGFVASKTSGQALEEKNGVKANPTSLSPEPFLLLPLDDLEKFAEARHFSMEEDLWLSTLLGVDFRIIPKHQSIWITRLDTNSTIPSDEQVKRLLQKGANPEREQSKLLQLSLSQSGFRYLLDNASAERDAMLRLSRKKVPPLKLPLTMAQFREQSIRYVPLLKAIEAVSNPNENVLIDCDLRVKTSAIDIEIRFANKQAEADSQEPTTDARPQIVETKARLQNLLSDQPLISQINSVGRIDKTVLDLVSSYFFCYPDEVEAKSYHQKTYHDYSDSLNTLLRSASSVESIDCLVEEKEPLVASQAILLEFPLAAESKVASRFAEIIDRWNLLLAASKARLKFEAIQEPFEFKTSAGQQLEATRVSIDMIKAFGGRRYEEIVALFEAIYGPDCLYRTDIINLGDGRWLLSRLSTKQNRELAQQLIETRPTLAKTTKEANVLGIAKPWQLEAKINLANYQAWNRRLDEISHQETIGHEPPKEMEKSPPIEIFVTRQQNQLVANLSVPVTTYQAGVEFLRGASPE